MTSAYDGLIPVFFWKASSVGEVLPSSDLSRYSVQFAQLTTFSVAERSFAGAGRPWAAVLVSPGSLPQAASSAPMPRAPAPPSTLRREGPAPAERAMARTTAAAWGDSGREGRRRGMRRGLPAMPAHRG